MTFFIKKKKGKKESSQHREQQPILPTLQPHVNLP